MRCSLVVLLFSVVLVFVSCEQESSDLGSEFIDTHTGLAYTDTVTVSVSTVLRDSVPTSGQNVILYGAINDGEFGAITANNFFQLQTPGLLANNGDLLFDSLTFNLRWNSFVYGDTTKPYNISVYRLTEEMADNSSGAYYNETVLAYDSLNCLGSYNERKLRPHRDPHISVRLSDVLGKTLFDKMIGSDDSINSQTKFLEYFKGIALVSPKSNSLVMGFNGDSAYMRLYYHQVGQKYTNSYVDFTRYSVSKQFNQVMAVRSGKLKNISYKNSIISSDLTNNCSYLQSSLGLSIKFSFPYIKDLTNFSKYYSILKAELIVKPVRNTYDYTFGLPPKIGLYRTDANYSIGNAITSYNGETNYGNLFTDYVFFKNTQYSYDITSYIISLLNTENISDMGLLFLSSTYASSLDRLIIGDQKNSENKTYLRLYYIRYDE
jgi:hypothetical protein